MMRKLFFTIIYLFSFTVGFSQGTQEDRIIGEWLNEARDRKIEIYKHGDHFYGKLIWGTDIFEQDGQTSKKDVRNPDKKLASRNLLDLVILHDFKYIDGIWDNGKMYDIKIGKTYHCLIKIKDDQLQIRSYVGVPLLGKSTYWQRAE